MSNKLAKSVSLPYNLVKGSFDYRQYKAEQFTHKVMQNLSGKIHSDGISLSKLSRDLKKVLPDNLKIDIKKNMASDSEAQINRFFTNDNIIVRQSLEFKPGENGKIGILDIPRIAHEIRHLADSLFHPKFLGREQILAKKRLDTPKYVDFYENEIYIKEVFEGNKDKKQIIKMIKHKIKKILRKHRQQDRIDFLQFIRYSLISEKNAYSDGSKYAKKLLKKHEPVCDDVLNNSTKEFIFEEKIKLIENMLLEIITKERKTHRAQLKKMKSKSDR